MRRPVNADVGNIGTQMKLMSFCLALIHMALPVYADSPFISLKGHMSNVQVVEVARIPQVRLIDKAPAQDGVIFVFRIDRIPGNDGYFTLSELRDFTINGVKYRKPDNVDIKTLVEPHTTIDEWTDYISGYRPDLVKYINDANITNSMTMITEIFGPELPTNGSCNVSIDVGWGKETEWFSYNFKLEDLKVAVTDLNK